MLNVKRVILCVTNDLSTDQRVHKTAMSLKGMGYTVLLVGRKLPNSPSINREYKTKRLVLLFRKGPLFYMFFNLRLFLYLLFQKADVIVSNDLDTLPACALISKWKRIQLNYDSHELFTEVPELIGRERVKRIWERIEKRYVKRVSRFYTVCKPIADIYAKKYNREVAVIRNLPLKKELENINKFERPTLIYQGALNLGRGIELMIDTMNYLPDYDLIIVGKGDLKSELKHRAENAKYKNVQLKGFVSFDQLNSLTAKAHIGLSWEEDLGLNYRYALPNKVFDYIQARIPVMVSNLPGLKSILDENRVGELLKSREPKKTATQIEQLYEKRHTFDDSIDNAAKELTWEKEQQKLIDLFRF
jgi:glycosyltransferase involved in cell wall biosynthesis